MAVVTDILPKKHPLGKTFAVGPNANPETQRLADGGDLMTVQGGLLNYADAAEYLGTTERHVKRLREYEEIEFVKVGRLVRFRPEGLDAYIELNTVHPATKRGPESGS